MFSFNPIYVFLLKFYSITRIMYMHYVKHFGKVIKGKAQNHKKKIKIE